SAPDRNVDPAQRTTTARTSERASIWSAAASRPVRTLALIVLTGGLSMTTTAMPSSKVTDTVSLLITCPFVCAAPHPNLPARPRAVREDREAACSRSRRFALQNALRAAPERWLPAEAGLVPSVSDIARVPGGPAPKAAAPPAGAARAHRAAERSWSFGFRAHARRRTSERPGSPE